MLRRGFRSAARSMILALAIILCLTQLAAASGTRISRPYTTDGYVDSAQVSARGDYAVYKTLKPIPNSDYSPALYSVPLAGGLPVRLTAPLPPETTSSTFSALKYKISPTGTRVIFQARQDDVNIYSLYSIPIEGGTAVRLSPPGHYSGPFIDPALSPDGQFVVFTTFYNNQFRLYRARPDGAVGSAVEITPHGATNFQPERIKISPDGQHILFTAKFDPDGLPGIYRMPIDGDGSVYTRLSQPNGYTDIEFYPTPDSQQVIYKLRQADAGGGETQRLYSVPITGPAADGRLVSGEDSISGTQILQFMVSPNSQYLVFLADSEKYGRFELFSADLGKDTVDVQKLNMALMEDRDVDYGFSISPDSSRVVYAAYWFHKHDLFSVLIHGPTNTNQQINAPVDSEQFMGWPDHYIFSPDSRRIIFTSNNTEDLIELFSVPADGQAADAVKLNLPLEKGASGSAWIFNFAVSPDGRYVLYAAPKGDNILVLYKVPLNGPAEKSVALSPAGAIHWFTFTPDSTRAVYIGGESWVNGQELFLATIQAKTYLPEVVR